MQHSGRPLNGPFSSYGEVAQAPATYRWPGFTFSSEA
jgi:hypothetical protein